MMLRNSEAKRVRMKLSEECSNADIISNLPDCVLSQILGFLPTMKEVVATSILSKRWINVWTCVDKIVFTAVGYVTQKMSFTQAVDRVLKYHQGEIKEFKLYYRGGGCRDSDVISWINTAIALGVERLDVEPISSWPLSIFTCKTLVYLKMNFDLRVCKIVPTAPIFPCLKKLHVPDLYVDTRIFKDIVSRCFALEHLIIDCRWIPIEIVSSSVKRLELHFTQPISYEKKILLGVPSLEYLQMDCTLPFEFTVVEGELSSLVEADIYARDLGCSGGINIKLIRESFGRFIKYLSNVKVLRIDCDFQRFLNFDEHGQFLNLTKLDIISPFFEWRLLVKLLEASINLEAITLRKTWKSTVKRHKLVWIAPKVVPTCLSSSLRKISIDGSTEDELPMVKYVLGTAQILEQMDIRFAKFYSDKLKNHLFGKIQKLPRACARCEILSVEKTLGCSLEDKWECTTTYHQY